MKPVKFLCYMFLLAFLALTVHRCVGATDQQKRCDKIFNCSMNIQTKDCALS